MSGARAIVAVDGLDGSGKSMFAQALMAALADGGQAPVLLRVDDFRRPQDWSRPGRTEAQLYYDDYYDLADLDRCLRDFLAGADSVEIPHYDAAAERLSGTRAIAFGAARLAVVEGVFILRVPTVAAEAAVIYVQVTADEARRRVLARDVGRGRAATEVARRIDARYAPGQIRYHQDFDPVGRAAVVVDNEDPQAPRTLRLDPGRVPDAVLRALGVLVRKSAGAHSRTLAHRPQ